MGDRASEGPERDIQVTQGAAVPRQDAGREGSVEGKQCLVVKGLRIGNEDRNVVRIKTEVRVVGII